MKVNQEFIPSFVVARRLICAGLVFIASMLCAAEKQPPASGAEIKFTVPREGTVLVNIYRSDGTLARRLVPGAHFAKGAQKLTWDGLLDDGTMAPPGDYTWKGLFHEGIGLKLRGWVGSGGGLPWATEDGKGGWGGDGGVPSAVAADDKQVYLGWSMAKENASVLACDLEGRVQWKSRRDDEGRFGCKALAVDDGIVYVLGGSDNGQGRDIQYADGKVIYRLNAQDGKLMPWPNGEVDLKIFSLWPADSKTRPDMANAMSVRHGHIYLSFTNSQFLTVLDAKTGAYLQTVVGAPPGIIDVAPTQTPLPDSPDKLSDADFGVISLGDGVIGRILFAHDPFWVVTSDMAQLERDATFTALTVIGDHGKYHPRTAFLGYGAPYHQVKLYSLLNMDEPVCIVGRPGGRTPLGPWQADGLRAVRGLALAADGKLWVAESDGFPKRFSVWDTTGKQGKLVREFFGSPDWSAPDGAINPLDPDIMAAENCEWRIDRKTGAAACLGVIARDEVFGGAHYGVGKNGHAYLLTCYYLAGGCPMRIFERIGDGDYKLRGRIYWTLENGKEAGIDDRDPKHTVFWADKNGDGKEQPDELTVVSEVLHFDAPRHLHNLDLQYRKESGENWVLPVAGWTSCGAPQYDPERPKQLPPHARPISADGKLCLAPVRDYQHLGLGCFDVESGRKLWEIPSSGEDASGYMTKDGPVHWDELIGGGAHLQAPLKNVWAVGECGGRWCVVTEDGFLLGHLFKRPDLGAHWPDAAKPGIDLSEVDSRSSGGGSVTQAANGKVYVQAGRDAYWNLELTGLEKVKALSGGKLTVPAAK